MFDSKTKERLRYLAAKQLEVANSEKNLSCTKDWIAHNTLKGNRPMLHLEIDNFVQEVIEPELTCTDPLARKIEARLLYNCFNMTHLGDDRVVAPYFGVMWKHYFHPLGFEIKSVQASDQALGHQFEHQITDLGDEFDKIQPSRFGILVDETEEYYNAAKETFDDIIPVKKVMKSLTCSLTQDIVHIMGMENMFYTMYDYPEEFKQAMDMLSDDYLKFFKMLEKDGYLLPTTGYEELNQGSICLTDELPSQGPVTLNQVWGFMDSQETVGVDPDMFEELVFPYYKKVGENFGLLSYGCCEPLDPVWERVKEISTLRKVSISAWANEEKMGEYLKGGNIIYQRKPSPNFIGVGTTLDEAAWRDHINKTLDAAKGCKLEFTIRDAYSINNDIAKAKRAVDIMKECIGNKW